MKLSQLNITGGNNMFIKYKDSMYNLDFVTQLSTNFAKVDNDYFYQIKLYDHVKERYIGALNFKAESNREHVFKKIIKCITNDDTGFDIDDFLIGQLDEVLSETWNNTPNSDKE